MTVTDNALQSIRAMGGLPIILIIFAGIAIFLLLRLRSVLGKRVGFEKPPLPQGSAPPYTAPTRDAWAPLPDSGRSIPDPRSELGQRLMQIVKRDRNFDPPQFLAQAETAFRTIVTAFAKGDRATLNTLLTPHVYETFTQVIAAREAANERQHTEVDSILSAEIEDAQIVGDVAVILVRFSSAQTNQHLDNAGTPIPGSLAHHNLTDLWSFERNLKGADPVWRLTAARSG